MIIEIVITLLAFPAGLLLAWTTRDELIQGRKWFAGLAVISLLAGIAFIFLGPPAIAMTFFFMGITSFVSYFKSFDKKWSSAKRC